MVNWRKTYPNRQSNVSVRVPSLHCSSQGSGSCYLDLLMCLHFIRPGSAGIDVIFAWSGVILYPSKSLTHCTPPTSILSDTSKTSLSIHTQTKQIQAAQIHLKIIKMVKAGKWNNSQEHKIASAGVDPGRARMSRFPHGQAPAIRCMGTLMVRQGRYSGSNDLLYGLLPLYAMKSRAPDLSCLREREREREREKIACLLQSGD